MVGFNFVYSRIYFVSLNRHQSCERDWEAVKEIGKRFETDYRDILQQSKILIPRVVGMEWQKSVVDIYLVDWCGPSFSHPLTLKVREDGKLMLAILIHELLHDFYLKQEKNKSMMEIEDEINNKVEEVAGELGLDLTKQMKALRENTVKRKE